MQHRQNRAKLQEQGYFFHTGGDLPGTARCPKKRGVWRRVDSPVQAEYVAATWQGAWERFVALGY